MTLPGGASLTLPAGAVSGNTRVSGAVVSAPAAVFPQGLGLAGSVYAFTPHGTEFSKPATLHVPAPAGAVALVTLTDDSDSTWEAVEAAHTPGGFDVVVNHISLFAAAAPVTDGGGAGGTTGTGGSGNTGGGGGATSSGGSATGGARDGGDAADGSEDSGAATSDGGGVTPRTSLLAVGPLHSCAVTGGQVKCWGADDQAQLGDGRIVSELLGSNVPIAAIGVNTAVEVSCGMEVTAARLANGTVMAWGRNFEGQLGTANPGTLNPVLVPGVTNAKQLSVGGYHLCVLTTDDLVRCWGSNRSGELGNGTTSTTGSPPVTVLAGQHVRSVSAGAQHTCAVLDTGTVECWGDNTYGQIGIGSPSSVTTPTVVAGLPPASAVSAGNGQTCALLQTGTVMCWGDGEYGQLGDDQIHSPSSVPTPVSVASLSNVVQVSSAYFSNCALVRDGTVHCWGMNTSEQMGPSDAGLPVGMVQVANLTDVAQVAAATDHTCALLRTGGVKCWGYGVYGNLGDGNIYDAAHSTARSPVSVVGFP